MSHPCGLQVAVQLTVRLQGTDLLRFGPAAADAVLAEIEDQVDGLGGAKPAVQQIAHYACADPQTQGVGCRLSSQQLAAGERL